MNSRLSKNKIASRNRHRLCDRSFLAWLTQLCDHATYRLFDLAKAEIVSLEINNPQFEHPWMKFAGIFKDDPQFDEVLADIEAYRRERDAEMEEYYRQLDADESDLRR